MDRTRPTQASRAKLDVNRFVLAVLEIVETEAVSGDRAALPCDLAPPQPSQQVAD